MANQASPIDVTGGPENRAGGPSRLHRKLTEAIRHVDEGQRIVARQRELKQFPAYLNRWDSQQARNEGVFGH